MSFLAPWIAADADREPYCVCDACLEDAAVGRRPTRAGRGGLLARRRRLRVMPERPDGDGVGWVFVPVFILLAGLIVWSVGCSPL